MFIELAADRQEIRFGRRGQQKGLLTAPAELTIWRQLIPRRIRPDEVHALMKRGYTALQVANAHYLVAQPQLPLRERRFVSML